MPRPANGYVNTLGEVIPGVTDITKRFADKERLLYWAFNQGKKGLKRLYDDVAINIGTAVHAMAELDLKDRPQEDIAFYAQTTLREREHLDAAQTAFLAFKSWRNEFHVRPYRQEVSLVSERHQFGGTLDTVAVINNGLGLLDFKTSSGGEVYPDHVIQLAAYEVLWQENFPDDELTEGAHLIVLPKDGSKPAHRHYAAEQLAPFRDFFLTCRRAYDLDSACANPQALAGSAVKPSRQPTPREKITPRIENKPRGMSMAEIMRAYGHVREQVTA